MKNSYRFYRNTDCKFFPCHKIKDDEKFNCMFCYCPLYPMENCGGNYFIHNGIKDCTKCLIPHMVEGYQYITNKIITNNRAKKVQ